MLATLLFRNLAISIPSLRLSHCNSCLKMLTGKRDVIACLSTGKGKSLIYQAWPGLCTLRFEVYPEQWPTNALCGMPIITDNGGACGDFEHIPVLFTKDYMFGSETEPKTDRQSRKIIRLRNNVNQPPCTANAIYEEDTDIHQNIICWPISMRFFISWKWHWWFKDQCLGPYKIWNHGIKTLKRNSTTFKNVLNSRKSTKCIEFIRTLINLPKITKRHLEMHKRFVFSYQLSEEATAQECPSVCVC